MKIKNILKLIWELPQNALGYIVLKVTKAVPYTWFYMKGISTEVFSWKYSTGLSLGKYIFIPFKPDKKLSFDVLEYIRHEQGHSIQSKYLGWLYLLVIGLPSAIWCNCFGKYREKHNVSYYDFYTEKWADKLGGVER